MYVTQVETGRETETHREGETQKQRAVRKYWVVSYKFKYNSTLEKERKIFQYNKS